jgi:hypothetical protein
MSILIIADKRQKTVFIRNYYNNPESVSIRPQIAQVIELPQRPKNRR